MRAFEKLTRDQIERALAQSMNLNQLVFHPVCPDCRGTCIQTKTGFVGAHYYPDLRDALKESRFYQDLYGESILGYIAEQKERTLSPTTAERQGETK